MKHSKVFIYTGRVLHANEYTQTKKWSSTGKPLAKERSFPGHANKGLKFRL